MNINHVSTRLIGVLITIIIAFAVLFEPSESNIGGSLFPDLPLIVATLSEVVGNLTWVFGLVYVFIILGVINTMSSDADMEKAFNTLVENNNLENFIRESFTLTVQRWITLVVAIVAIVAIGSGFWFTGTTLILAIIALQLLRNKAKNMNKERLKNSSIVSESKV